MLGQRILLLHPLVHRKGCHSSNASAIEEAEESASWGPWRHVVERDDAAEESGRAAERMRSAAWLTDYWVYIQLNPVRQIARCEGNNRS